MARYFFIAKTGHRGVFVPLMTIVWPTRKGSVLDSFIFYEHSTCWLVLIRKFDILWHQVGVGIKF